MACIRDYAFRMNFTEEIFRGLNNVQCYIVRVMNIATFTANSHTTSLYIHNIHVQTNQSVCKCDKISLYCKTSGVNADNFGEKANTIEQL